MNTCDYIIGDSRDIEGIFRKHKIIKPDLIVTSPPYFDVKNYENNDGQIGFGQDYDAYLNDIIKIFQKCYELSSSHATFWMVMDTVRKDGVTVPLPFDINKELANQPSQTWRLKDVVIWDKTKNIPWNAKGRFKNHFEYIFFYAKDEQYKFNIDKIREIADLKKWWLTYPERYNPRGKAPSNLWEFTTPIRGWGNGCLNHFCPFPFPLAERIISISTDENDFVFDPFAGSGSVIAMASVMNRNAVGIDINEKYKQQFEREVLIGAQKYWEKRNKELKLISENIQEFKLTNNKLRKQKLGSLIFQWLKAGLVKNVNPFFIILENDNTKKEIDCIIVNDVANVDISSIHNDGGIKDLVRKFKVDINWKIMKKQDIISALSSTNLYKYDPKQFYKSISAVSLADILDGKDKGKHFFSNINLNISKASEVFKK
ncbi:MAG TPA: site-specific DNA-methyltransferase [Desulfobacteria bacterium]|nr:site-specific DNA-methyltransferase [Desulfobacteria bacterium]